MARMRYSLSLKTVYLLPALFSVLLCGQSPGAATAPGQIPKAPIRIGETEKVCQLTGDKDWETGHATAARTFANFGLDAVDLGYPVEHNGKLILLFGDSWPAPHGAGPMAEVIADDAVGETSRMELPTSDSCLDLIIHTHNQPGRKVFQPGAITGPIRIPQGLFNVPAGGVSVGGALYGFFWTNHCSAPNAMTPMPEHPLTRPEPTAHCPETNERNSVGRGVMARSDDNGRTFHDPKALPPPFVTTIAVNTRPINGLPDDQKLGVFIFGVPRYRMSVPYLAYSPVETFSDPETWRFFSGRNDDGTPRWVARADWHWGPAAQIYTPMFEQGNNVGEFSITWNPALKVWVMLYGGVLMRVANAPWGPWSAPATLLGAADQIGCKLVMTAAGCGDRRDFWPGRKKGDRFEPGGLYAPYVLNRYTRPGPSPHTAIIYWLLSTWNPYEVNVMRTTLRLSD